MPGGSYEANESMKVGQSMLDLELGVCRDND